MSVYGYIRLNKQRKIPKNFDLGEQSRIVREWSEEHGYKIKEIFREIEPTSTSLELPKLKKLIKLIQKGEVKVILVARLDRLTRSIRLYQKLLYLFEEHKNRFISIKEDFSNRSENKCLVSRYDLFVV